MVSDAALKDLASCASDTLTRALGYESLEARQAALLEAFAHSTEELRFSLFYVSALILARRCAGEKFVADIIQSEEA